MTTEPPAASTPPEKGALRCRAIEEADLDAVIALLRRGFDDRTEAYWRTGLARHIARRLPPDVPRYGFLLDHAGGVVGVLLALYSPVETAAGPRWRCNLSSWYVEPPFRAMAVLLDGHAMRDKSVTYLNVSPAPHTWAMHEPGGFRRYCRGQGLALPWLARRMRGQRVLAFSSESAALLDARERRLARDHADYGCVVLVCAEGTAARPVVFQARRLKVLPGVPVGPRALQLIYGPSGAEMARWLGAIGRHLLLRHAAPLVVLDADGPLPGVAGRYFEGRAPKFFKGPDPVPLGDLSYTEIVLFGA